MSELKLTNKGWLIIIPTTEGLSYLYFKSKEDAIIRARALGLIVK